MTQKTSKAAALILSFLSASASCMTSQESEDLANNCVSDPIVSGDSPDIVPNCPDPHPLPPDDGVPWSTMTVYQVHSDAVPGEFVCHWDDVIVMGGDRVRSQFCTAAVSVPFTSYTHVICVLTWIRRQGNDDWNLTVDPAYSGCNFNP
jgi:hypothetical protein